MFFCYGFDKCYKIYFHTSDVYKKKKEIKTNNPCALVCLFFLTINIYITLTLASTQQYKKKVLSHQTSFYVKSAFENDLDSTYLLPDSGFVEKLCRKLPISRLNKDFFSMCVIYLNWHFLISMNY